MSIQIMTKLIQQYLTSTVVSQTSVPKVVVVITSIIGISALEHNISQQYAMSLSLASINTENTETS